MCGRAYRELVPNGGAAANEVAILSHDNYYLHRAGFAVPQPTNPTDMYLMHIYVHTYTCTRMYRHAYIHTHTISLSLAHILTDS